MKTMLLIAGILTALLLSATLARADSCGMACTGTIWELQYQGNTVSFGDMTKDECGALQAEIEAQTEPFTDLLCVEVPVSREDS